jgi:hypothetical protein
MVILTQEEFGSALQHLTIFADHHVAAPVGLNSRVNRQPVQGLQRLHGQSHRPARPSSEHLQMMLDRIFSRIDTLHTLNLVSALSTHTSPDDNIGLEPLTRTNMLSEASILMILSAISQGNTRVSRFGLGSRQKGGSHCLNIMNLNAGSIELHKKGLRKLNSIKELTVNFYVNFDNFVPDPNALQHEQQVAAEFPIAFLGLVPSVEILELALSSPHGMVPSTIFGAISYGYKPAKLVKCSIHMRNVRITLQDMERFFRSCLLLRVLHLEGLHLAMIGDVEETLEAFRNVFGKMKLDTCTTIDTVVIGHNSQKEVSDEHWVPGFPGHWVETETGHILY